MARLFSCPYFSQGEDGANDCDAIDERGVESWLEYITGAIDLTEGETCNAPPWGSADSLEYESEDSDSIVRVHMNRALGYVGISTEWKDGI